MLKTQRWSPDTCECIIEQTFDYLNDDPGVFVSHQIVKACTAHTQPNDALAENQAKNQGVTKTAEILGMNASDIIWQIDASSNISLTQVAKIITASDRALLDTELAKISPKLKVI